MKFSRRLVFCHISNMSRRNNTHYIEDPTLKGHNHDHPHRSHRNALRHPQRSAAGCRGIR
nr:MAG TPA: hypothetical protein [Caudoviricetes sp.]DAM93205.1 MAG TPA: hypothetical protein [Caudoviricetes sp.]